METRVTFEPITEETLWIAEEIVNSNPAYNCMENGNPVRSIDELRPDFINNQTTSALVKLDDTYIGLIDYLMENPNDNCPWLGLLMTHQNYKGLGYGREAYFCYEKLMIANQANVIRIGVLEKNLKARKFWESIGFVSYDKKRTSTNVFDCFEKKIILRIDHSLKS